MTQRIRSCSSNTNLDTVNCDAYQTRLLPRSKAPQRSGTRECLVTQSKGSKKTKARCLPKESSKSSLAIEANKNRQPWASLLAASTRSIDSASTFDGCDPLRTVRFLSEELCSKLHGDPHVYNLVLSMQHALNRVPTEGAKLPASGINDYHKEIPERLLPEKAERGSQTRSPPQQVNTAKLQFSCEQIEKSYNTLKREKEHTENLLRLESERLAGFQKRNAALQRENAALARQRDDLERQDSDELKARIEDLLKQRTELEHENIGLRHRLTTADIEKEKFIALLSMRDRQINEILAEIDALQAIVREQLSELQKVSVVSSASSLMTLLSDCET